MDLVGVPLNEFAMSNRGQAVPIQVVGSDADPAVFGPGASIRFVADKLDTLYTGTNVYTLKLDSVSASRMQVDGSAAKGVAATSYIRTEAYAPQSRYSFTSPDSQDPWFADRLVAVDGPVSQKITMSLPDLAVGGNVGSAKATLSVNAWGAADLAGNNDHSVSVAFNGEAVTSKRFDGLTKARLSGALHNIQSGDNEVEVTLPMDTGKAYDAVNLDTVEISYPSKFVAKSGRLNFTSSFGKFRIQGFDSDLLPNGQGDLLVVRQDAAGTHLMTNIKVACRSSGCLVETPGSGSPAQYYVSSINALHTPQLDALPLEDDIMSGQAAYLIISHPDFIGGAGNFHLENLATSLQSEMGSVDIIDVESIYAQFGDHIFDPQAIRDYIRYAHANRGTRYVLLVGGDVYDYRQFENDDAESFIPSFYAATGNHITFAPVDARYADVNDDNVPDIPLGRLPVRTVSHLAVLINKRNDFLNREYVGEALLVADAYDQVQQYDFSTDADEVEADFLQNFSVDKAYVDELGVSSARQKVRNTINNGTTLTAFFGHSSTNQWSFNGLFTGPDAAGLSNAGKPTVVTQWGCWNAYYVSPNEDSMGHRFMMEGDRGAVAVMGATTLTDADSERRLARMVFARLANGERLGDAITNAKQEYAQDNPNDLDVLLGWTLLGMPDLILN